MIPQEFLARMERLLGDGYPTFLEALGGESTHALRLCRKKTDGATLLSLLPFAPMPLSFFDGGYLVPHGERPGIHPLHHAGAYYMQDPSAMATVAALPFPIRGCRVLDLCAAPGGKSGQLADLVGEGGTLVSNELVPARARVLLGNIERLGCENTAVLSADPRAIAEMYDRYFDLTVVDAPCSGEGMFRKYPEACDEWSPAAVEAAAARGRLILDEAAKTVREGGRLLYSTCTFSEEENEETVSAFLAAHPDFALVPVAEAVRAVTAPGIAAEGRHPDITLTRRYYPHLAPGEGQYIALLERRAGGVGGPTFRDACPALPKGEEAAVRAALSELLTEVPSRIVRQGDTYLAPPEGMPLPPRGLLRAGVALGSFSGKVFLPHHQLASAMGNRFRNQLLLKKGDPRVAAYLHGEEIAADPALRGFSAVLYEGIPLGLAKCSGGRAKNHYPKGLRA